MPQHAALQVKFLGVRGSIPTPLPGHLGYGGNTTCLEVSCADDRLVIDAGSGILTLGPALLAEFGNQDFEVHLLMTHFHWDHIQGLPYFTPLFRNNCRLTFYSGNPPDMARRSLDGQISEPYFPALDSVTAHRQFVQIGKEPFRRGSVMVHPFPLNHPQGAWGYRLEAGAAVIVHASDLEHGHRELDAVLRDYAQNADVLIYDAQYSEAEYESKKGWGHSTYREAARVAHDAHVKHLILFHHDPLHDDDAVSRLVDQARYRFENTDGAQEGCVLSVPTRWESS